MRVLAHSAVGLLATVATIAHAAPAPDGKWQRDDGNARVLIAPCGANLCVTNIWIRDSSGGEAVGDRLVLTVAPQPGGGLAGTAYDPKRDKTYAITITVGTAMLVTRGCILHGMLCRSVTWSRLPD